MHIEQKIEVNGPKITVTRSVQYAGNTAVVVAPARPPDKLTDHVATDDDIAKAFAAASTASPAAAASSTPPPGGAIRVFILGPGGNLEELGSGGNLEGLGSGGNLSTGVTLILGGINIQSCCHRDETPGSTPAA